MDEIEYQEALQFFGGSIPPGFEAEFTQKKRFLHTRGETGPLRPPYLYDLYWHWREFWPPKFCAINGTLKDLAEEIIPLKEEVQVVENGEVTWETVQEGHRVAARFNGRFPVWGSYLGPWGEESVKIAFKGDDKEFRRIPKAEVDLNGRE